MNEHRVRVENGKYEFIQRGGWKLDVLRHGQPWAEDVTCSKAIGTMMAELDAARVVLAAARRTVEIHHEGIAPIGGLRDALEKYDRLVDDREPPSEWTK